MHLIDDLMDTCKDICRLVSDGMDRELTIWERLRIRMHVAMCRVFTNFTEQMNVLRAASRKYVDRISTGGKP